ncbi:MAG TPA: DEAD/DEAH box helicase [Spirochaetota bacterium]|nr:DEAD/DEAH box helicase [Spirochaetota bacterium]
MKVSDYLVSVGYVYLECFETLTDEKRILSDVYFQNKTIVVIDSEIICETPFEYKRYCQKQNEWMKKYDKVYRFMEDDLEMATIFLENREFDYITSRTFNRENTIIDPTPLEYHFENCFAEAFGPDSFKYLQREYSFMLKDGKTAYIDYALFHSSGRWVAIEENGISYHHPYIIKKEKYRKILFKQNSAVEQNGIVYRWDTESMGNLERVADEIKEFMGDIKVYKVQSSVLAERRFKFYDHQAEHLSSLVQDRQEGYKSSLVVLPTGTGKSIIALEDMTNYYNEKGAIRGLIHVPTIDLREQWQKQINESPVLKDNVSVITYAHGSRNYQNEASDAYDYIVIDEAHHSTAPTLRKMIRHYSPDFLLGLTATDKRLDEEKLEDVFGEYEISIDLKTAIEKGILSQIRCFRLETNIDLSKVRFNGKDYYASELEKTIKVPSRNKVIVDVIEKYFVDKLAGKSGVIFCVNVAHSKDMAQLLKERGIIAESVDGQDKNREEKIGKYMNREIQFLCTCSLLNEGWDAPHTSVIVMARPTMSKVLYTQQLGRGTRKHHGKEALYVIDVVDNYGSFGGYSNRPWSLHALFELEYYKKFGNLFDNVQTINKELTVLDTIYEEAVKLDPFDIFTMEKMYGDYLGIEQLARELFVSYGTVKSWLSKNQITADVVIPMGRSSVILFKPEKIEEIRTSKNLKIHSEDTIVEDFRDFINQGDYTFSYKMFFILALLDTVDSTGDAQVDKILDKYIAAYIERFDKQLVIDRNNCPYQNREYVLNKELMKRSMLENPFEKFERKRFMYHAKDLSKISIHHKIWDYLTTNSGLAWLRGKMYEDIDRYYNTLNENNV